VVLKTFFKFEVTKKKKQEMKRRITHLTHAQGRREKNSLKTQKND